MLFLSGVPVTRMKEVTNVGLLTCVYCCPAAKRHRDDGSSNKGNIYFTGAGLLSQMVHCRHGRETWPQASRHGLGKELRV